jgi:glycosyltransferase involved in cell wall biosynthesis
MKIACITTSVIPSNTANSIQAMKVCHALKELGNDVRLWVPEFKRCDWQDLAHVYGLRTEFEVTWLSFVPLFKQYDFNWKAVRAARDWGADVIYTWSLQTAVFTGWRNMPAVMEFHDFPMGKFGPRLFRILINSHKKKLTLCTTRALAQGLEEIYHFQFQSEELQIAPNGVELDRYERLPDPQTARKELHLKPGFTIAYSGHFYAGRGMDLLADLAKAFPQVNFIWMGGRPADVAPWQEKLNALSIRNVTITGFIPNSQLPKYQAAADILLMPYSRRISGSSGGDIARVINPMKMFDYLATGRAIAASDIPVFHEVLSDKNAMFCEPENSQDWSRKIAALIADEALRSKLGRQAKKDAAKFTWKRRTQTTLKKLEGILK